MQITNTTIAALAILMTHVTAVAIPDSGMIQNSVTTVVTRTVNEPGYHTTFAVTLPPYTLLTSKMAAWSAYATVYDKVFDEYTKTAKRGATDYPQPTARLGWR